jgi:M6 family metalloprotease-like protein/uncharacterized repeat protein (TIGR01451 family)
MQLTFDRLCAVGLVLLVTSLLRGQAVVTRETQIAGTNQELSRLATDPLDASAISRIRQLTRSRLSVLTDVLQSDPAEALRLALPETTLQRLRVAAPDIGEALESRGEWSGPAEVVAEDDFEHGASRTHTSITAEGRKLKVLFAGSAPAVRSGAVIRIKGLRVGDLVAASEAMVQTAALGCSTTGQQKIAVLMLNFASSQIPSSINAGYLNNMLFGAGGHSMKGYWNEASFGQVSASGDVFGPFNLGADFAAGQYDQVRDAAINAAASSVTFQNYNHVLLVLPPGYPTGGGLGTIGCESLSYDSAGFFQAGIVWLRSDFLLPNDVGVCATSHENGHNLGLEHASSESYGSVPLGPLNAVPVHDEYGDRFSVMGQCFTYNFTTLLGHYAAQHKIALGWMASSNYQTVTSAGSFTLQPIENATTGLQALRVQRGAGNNLWLWLEYRQPIGYDATFGNSGFSNQPYSGAIIHYDDPSNTSYLGYTRLLNFSAATRPTDFIQPALTAGSTWSDPYSSLNITVNSASASGLNVSINYGASCASVSPTTRSYSTSAAVASDSISVTGPSSCAWTAVSNAPWITVLTGSSGSGSGTVTYSLSANAGQTVRTGTIAVAQQSVSITQAGSVPPPFPVSVTPGSGSSAAGVRQIFQFAYSDGAGVANLAKVSALFNTSPTLAAACYVAYFTSDNTVRLYNDAGTGGYTYSFPGVGTTISNSQCSVDLSATGVFSSGNSFVLTIGVSFLSSFAGARTVYLEAQDTVGTDSGFVALGSWTISTPNPSVLSISKTHTGNFTQGQAGATYTVTVSNQAGAGPTNSQVSVTDTVPTGLTLVSMSGGGWTCPNTTCTRSDTLNAGSSYPGITVTVNVAATAPSQVINRVTVSGGGSASASATDTTNVVAPPPVSRVDATGGTPQSTPVGAAFSQALQATVRDSSGNLMSGVTVTFAAPPTGASATLSSTSAVTNASGVASVTATANSTPGSYSVTATVGALSASFSLTNTAASPASVTAAGGTPQAALLGAAFLLPLQTTVRDAAGNPLSGVTVTFSAPTTGASATLSSPTAITNASGIASITATANNTPGAYTVTAAVGALSAPFSLTNAAASPAGIAATGGTPQSTLLGTAFPSAIQATVKDSGGNLLPGVTVTFSAPPSGPSAILSSTTAVTNAAGVASVTATANNTPGSYTVTASVGNVIVGTISAPFSLTNLAGSPATIAATGGTPQSTFAGATFPSALQATVKDASGNPVSGVIVIFAAPPTGASAILSSASALTNASGVASVTATANAIAGSYTVTATVGTHSAPFSLTNTPGSPTSIAATGGTPQSTLIGAAFPNALQATVKDQAGNPVTGVTVTFTAPASGPSASLSNSTVVTNSSGVASVTATANAVPGSYAVTATVGVFSTTFSLTNAGSPPATIVASSGTPQSTLLNAAFPAALQVTVRDASGLPVTGATVTFTAPTAGASALLSSATALTNTSGVAAVTATANTIAGSYNVLASVGALSTSFSLTNILGGSSNLALGRIATQSSTFPGYPTAGPGSAVDGNPDGNFSNGSVTATNLDTNAWWQVDLGASASVGSVIVYNRTDCCGTRLSDFWVFISDTPFQSTDTPASLQTRAGTFSSHQTVAPNPSVTIAANGAQGRYVRVQLTNTNYLSLAEVQVIGTGGAPPPTNLAQGRPATQSSTLAGYAGADAASAVDGNTNGSFFGGSVTATNADVNAWWQVDLGASATVSSVVVFNRTDCCGTRLSDFWIFVSDTPFQPSETPATLQARPGTFSSHQGAAPNPSTNIAVAAQGRYVRIQLTGANYLSLAEVQVFGSGGAPAPVNLARGKAASQSSTLPGYATAAAAAAVDGSTDGSFFNGSVTATNLDPNPWWQVDLGASAAVSSVAVFNRTDCCGTRLSDYWVFVSDTPFLSTDTPATLQNRAATFSSHQTTAPNPSTAIPVGASGRYVRVQLTSANYLSLAEVQVFGQ